MYLSCGSCCSSVAESPSDAAGGALPLVGYVETSTPICATETSTAVFGTLERRRSFSLENRYEARARRVAMRPEMPISSLLPAGVQRTTVPFPLNQQPVAAIRHS